MKKIIQKIIHPFYKGYHFWFHRKPRKYAFKDVYTIIQPGVFSPKHTVSTKVFLDYISTLPLQYKMVFELGCGSGIIALQCAKMEAHVTASDINQTALDSLKEVAEKQGLKIVTVYSNILDDFTASNFDYIFINPPFFPRKAANVTEKAWFCGEKFEFFEEMFSQLSLFNLDHTQVLMILSDACDMNRLNIIADKNHLCMKTVYSLQLTFEKDTIYRIAHQ
ncbi:MAG: release factor glutamine methyltransferase [Halieaceae bacterium]|jgi:release factor glutamine methyltransferase